jgi:hypothetical protein
LNRLSGLELAPSTNFILILKSDWQVVPKIVKPEAQERQKSGLKEQVRQGKLHLKDFPLLEPSRLREM